MEEDLAGAQGGAGGLSPGGEVALPSAVQGRVWCVRVAMCVRVCDTETMRKVHLRKCVSWTRACEGLV